MPPWTSAGVASGQLERDALATPGGGVSFVGQLGQEVQVPSQHVDRRHSEYEKSGSF